MIFSILFFAINVFAQVNFNEAQDLVNVSELRNGGAENGKTGWTTTGGLTSAVFTYADPSKQFGKRYFSLAYDTSDTGVFEQIINTPDQLKGQGCIVEAWTKLSSSATSFEIQILNASNTLIGNASFDNTDTALEKVTANFSCPSSGVTKVRFVRNLGGSAITVSLDNISLRAADLTPSKFIYSGKIVSASGGIIQIVNTNTTFNANNNNANLALVTDFDGSSDTANARIACQDGTAPVGTTCNSAGVNENVGIVLTFPGKGVYEVCGMPTSWHDSTNDCNIYYIGRTPVDATTSLSDFTFKLLHKVGDTTGTARVTNNYCRNFKIDGPGDYAFRVWTARVCSGGSELFFNTDEVEMPWTVKEL